MNLASGSVPWPQSDCYYVHWQDQVSRPVQLRTRLVRVVTIAKYGHCGGAPLMSHLSFCSRSAGVTWAGHWHSFKGWLSTHPGSLHLPESATLEKMLRPTLTGLPPECRGALAEGARLRKINKTGFGGYYPPSFTAWISGSSIFQMMGVYLFLPSEAFPGTLSPVLHSPFGQFQHRPGGNSNHNMIPPQQPQG